MKHKFITFEGSEACGKTTQIQLLTRWLKEQGRDFVSLREPGGTALGEAVRHLLKHDPAGLGMVPEAEMLLFAASRAELVRKAILPALNQGQWVICDRFHDSTLVYQGLARGLGEAAVEQINQVAIQGVEPTLTLVLDLDPKEAQSRLQRRPNPIDQEDRMEKEPPSFYEAVTAGYHKLAAQHPQRVKLIPAAGSREEVFQLVLKEVQHAFRGQLD